MSTLGSMLQAAAGPLARRALQALGIGVLTYVGVDTALGALLSTARTSWTGMSADVAAYVAMAGGNTALSIIAGALVARITLISLKRLTLL